MVTAYVVRLEYVADQRGPGGVGYLTKEGWCTRDPKDAHRYATMAEAWDHLRSCGALDGGDVGWVEDADEKDHSRPGLHR